ncbi:MAG: hypothetical protein HUK26_02000 [Duodenibacillus sp.]|nr:hypothetical protein [Duodenibacillus sp.]
MHSQASAMPVSLAATAAVAAAVVLAVALVTWLLLKHARRFPPALRHPAHASGVGGLMAAFMAGQVFFTLLAVWRAASILTALLMSPYKVSPDAGLMLVLPIAAAAALSAAMLWILASGRTPHAVGAAVVLLWLMGPGAELLQSWYLDVPLGQVRENATLAWKQGWTAYLALSRRVALTYGTAKGRRLAAGGSA